MREDAVGYSLTHKSLQDLILMLVEPLYGFVGLRDVADKACLSLK